MRGEHNKKVEPLSGVQSNVNPVWNIPEVKPTRQATSSTLRYVLWLAGRQKGVLIASVICGIITFTAQAVMPYAIGRALDAGLDEGISQHVLGWAGVMLAAGVIQVTASGLGHRFDVLAWLRAALTSTRLIGESVSSTGDAIREELPTGEVVSSVTTDAHRLGDMYMQLARFVGSVATYAVVGIVMLNASLKLGLIVALGLPIVALVLAFLIKPLQKRQEHQREVTGRLTSLGSDTVTGLRILRGIGGESVFTGRYREQSQKVRAAGVEVAKVQSTMDGLQVLLPGMFVTLVLWIGAREAISGAITPGQLVTFYGYASFLTWPMQNLIQMVQLATRAKVGVLRILRVLAVTNRTPNVGTLASLPVGGELFDETSGAVLKPGDITALVGANPDVTAGIATRMTRFDDAAENEFPVSYNGVLLRDFDKDALRADVVLAEATPHIFAGTLRETLVTRSPLEDAEIVHALEICDANDVLESLPDGLDSELPEKGRSLSGGQRQRVALARALLTKARNLVLIEPTSAVDAHTEAKIGRELRGYRRGSATMIVTASPLVLEHMDLIQVVDESGTVIGCGTHRDLMSADSQIGETYRTIVGRDLDDIAITESSDGAPPAHEDADYCAMELEPDAVAHYPQPGYQSGVDLS